MGPRAAALGHHAAEPALLAAPHTPGGAGHDGGPPRVWFDSCYDNSHILHAVDVAVAELLEQTARLRGGSTMITRFDASKAPAISVRHYLERISKYAPCSSQCFTVALIYINRVCEINDDFVVTPLNVHRLLMMSVMLAVKFYEDFYYSNAYFAKVGGVRPDEVNALELDFLAMIKYDLQVHQDIFLRAWAHLLPKTLCTAQCKQDELYRRHLQALHGVNPLLAPRVDVDMSEPSFVAYLPKARPAGDSSDTDEATPPTTVDYMYPQVHFPARPVDPNAALFEPAYTKEPLRQASHASMYLH